MSTYGMLIDLDRCSGCSTCVVACQLNNNQRPGISWVRVDTVEWGAWPDMKRASVPHACMQCDAPPCVDVCPTGATAKREDGIVTIDYEVCIGCGLCADACPFGARTVSENDVWFYDAAEPAPYEAEGVQRIDVAEKCIFCHDRLAQGLDPACVRACVTGARVFGDLDDPGSAISTYIAANNAQSIPNTSMYYVTSHSEMDLLDVVLVAGATPPGPSAEATPPAEAEEAAGISPAAIGAGVVVVAAAAVGAGVAVKKSKDKKAVADSASSATAQKADDAGKGGE